jgi:ribose transport system permease protein
VLLSFVLAGTLAGVAGVLAISATGSADPQAGPNYLLPALSAAFLGATAIVPGRFNVLGTLLAVYFLAFTINGLNFLGFPSELEAIFNGTATINAVPLKIGMKESLFMDACGQSIARKAYGKKEHHHH